MYRNSLFTLASIFLLLVMFSGCKKDSPLELPSNQEESPILLSQKNNTKSVIPTEFFQLKESESPSDNFRTNIVYHPWLLEVYEEIKSQDSEHNFTKDLTDKIGFPIWNEASVTFNQQTGQNLVAIPFGFASQDELSAILHVSKINGKFLFEGMTRPEILLKESGDPIFKLQFARSMAWAEGRIFQKETAALDLAYCTYKEEENNNATIKEPRATGVPGVPCQWRIAERCADTETQMTWIAGLHAIPIHLDHDGDGILNENDQDYWDFVHRYDINPEDFQGIVFEYWEENFQEEHGSYADYYSEVYEDHFGDIYGGQDITEQLNDLWDQLSDIWGDFYDSIFQDPNETYGPQQGIDDHHYDNCDDVFNGGNTPIGNNNNIKRRGVSRSSVNCSWYYFYDCGLVYDWWNDYDAVPCPECPGFVDGQQADLDRLYILYLNEEILGATTFNDLYILVAGWGCNPMAPLYEECVMDNYMNFKFSNFLEIHRLNPDFDYFLNDVAECSINDNECFWNTIQSDAYQTNISYQEFATDVLPFLEGTGLYYEDLINANVDVKGCLASGDFGGCAWEGYIQEFVENSGLNSADQQFVLENPMEDGKITLPQEDWGNFDDDGRVLHFWKWYRFVNYYHRCKNPNPTDKINVTYETSDFWKNINGITTGFGGSASWLHTTDITYKNMFLGEVVTLKDAVFEWNVADMSAQTFLWEVQNNATAINPALTTWGAPRPNMNLTTQNHVWWVTTKKDYNNLIYTYFNECPN